MAILSWGAVTIEVEPITGTGATATKRTFKTNVEGSTELSTTQGDTTEAKIEGGDIEAVRYSKNTYELTWQERAKDTDSTQLANEDGVVAGEFKITLTPENTAAPGLTIARASINVQTSYSSEDGIITTYTASPLKPTSGNMVEIKAGTAAG